MNVKKLPLVIKEKPTEEPAKNGTTGPKNPQIQVNGYDAKERTWTPVELSE